MVPNGPKLQVDQITAMTTDFTLHLLPLLSTNSLGLHSALGFIPMVSSDAFDHLSEHSADCVTAWLNPFLWASAVSVHISIPLMHCRHTESVPPVC